MQTPQQILVVISGRRNRHPALQRALKFAEHKKVHLHLFNSIYEPVLELTDVLSSEHRKEMKRQYMADRYLFMDSLAKEITAKGIDCSVQVSWHRDLEEAIELAAAQQKPDLVIKRISANEFSLNPFALPIDRHLLRHCPAPLLLVNKSVWTSSPILAAIDPSAGDAEHIDLNRQILDYAKMMSHLNETELHVVSSISAPPGVSSFNGLEYDYAKFKQDVTSWHQSKLQNAVREFNLPDDHIHLVEGLPEDGINRIAQEIEAQIVVIGTVGRSGLSATFLGNTAERVLSQLRCEVIALKPAISVKISEVTDENT